MKKGRHPVDRWHALCKISVMRMLDPTLIARHEKVAAQSSWALPALVRDPVTSVRVLPPILRYGDFLSTYLERNRVSPVSASRPDKVRHGHYEAVISRRLGFKTHKGGATFIYWRHIPVARLMPHGETPHIFITPRHAGGKAQLTRTLFALNPLLDYLLTGVRMDMDGVSIERRHETTAWPKGMGKPALYIPVAGRANHAFWTARSFEFCKPDPLAYEYGVAWPDPRPWFDPIEGLI